MTDTTHTVHPGETFESTPFSPPLLGTDGYDLDVMCKGDPKVKHWRVPTKEVGEYNGN